MIRFRHKILMSRRVADIVTWLSRIVFGAAFMISGFTKGIDPWGTIYKMSDYIGAMGLHVWYPLILIGAIALCAVEFLVGVFVITGSFRRSIPWVAALIMAAMLPLTLWIAIADPVSDCGCFGDAFIISNWATFWKNVGLSACVVWLLLHNRKVHWLVTPALQWVGFVASFLFIVIIEFFGYYYQPLIDFRPYKNDTSLLSESANLSESDEADKFLYIYKKDGVERSFTIDAIPSEEEGWEFVDRKETEDAVFEKSKDTSFADDKNLRFYSQDEMGEEEDVTEEIVEATDRLLILTIPDLRSMSIASTWKINSLYTWSVRNNIQMIAIASGTGPEIDTWKDLSMSEYPIYTSEDTMIKELCRGNPGVVYVMDGIIKWKSTLRAIDIDDFLSPDTTHDPLEFRHDDMATLYNISGIYIAVMVFLILLSFLPKLRARSLKFGGRRGGDMTLDI